MGYLVFSDIPPSLLDTVLTVSLVFLYTGVGVSIGSNKEVFSYIRKLGLRIIFMPAAIFTGCIAGGFLSGLILGVPAEWSVLSAGGMGYYSLTGAFLTENFGIEAGTYGFIVNVSRDVFTVILLPLLSKVSKGSPIASGAAGCMDTMLVPVTKTVGPELGMVALISGSILTFVVPVWLSAGLSLNRYVSNRRLFCILLSSRRLQRLRLSPPPEEPTRLRRGRRSRAVTAAPPLPGQRS